VLFAFASIAVMNAAVVDGLVAPNVMRRIAKRAGAGEVGASLSLQFRSNQGFARLYAVTSSIAIIFWSLDLAKSHTRARFGNLWLRDWSRFGDRVIAGLGMDVHGFGAIVLGQAIWFITAAVLLRRRTRKIIFAAAVLSGLTRCEFCRRTIRRWASPHQLRA